jgi:dephospho-CoA kinase
MASTYPEDLPFRLIGLTGGIASGKSTVSARLAARGFRVIDADAVAREVVEPGSLGLAKVAEAFGSEILGEDGRLDRVALAKRVFADPKARAALNGILHPLIGQRTAELTRKAREAGLLLVVYDAPLIVENNLHKAMDLLVVVSAERAIQIERTVSRDAISRDEAAQRVAAQLPLEQKIEVADVVIDNSGDLEDTMIQVEALISSLPHRLWPDAPPPLQALVGPPQTGTR